jgi:hypothetical protein
VTSKSVDLSQAMGVCTRVELDETILYKLNWPGQTSAMMAEGRDWCKQDCRAAQHGIYN